MESGLALLLALLSLGQALHLLQVSLERDGHTHYYNFSFSEKMREISVGSDGHLSHRCIVKRCDITEILADPQ